MLKNNLPVSMKNQGNTKKVILSGIQPTGILHIGNYFGAIENWVKLTDEFNCFYTIVDLHAITVDYDPEELKKLVWETGAALIACGLTPENCALFVQSHVREHTELCWVFNTLTPLGSLERMTQFKDKSDQHKENINAGLLNYPILQAADIAIYRADLVPVGEDQSQHLELTREIIRKFNRKFGEVFPLPETRIGRAPRILGLDGKNKMSKSLGNDIPITDDYDEMLKKLASAVTDERRKRLADPGVPEDCNIFSIHKLVTPEDKLKEIHEGCTSAGIGCLDCKKILAQNLADYLEPVRKRKEELDKNPDEVYEILKKGMEKARQQAQETMAEVREKMGLG
ncbi:tryptophan--tRNA ligase [Planctomycetota bacterium]